MLFRRVIFAVCLLGASPGPVRAADSEGEPFTLRFSFGAPVGEFPEDPALLREYCARTVGQMQTAGQRTLTVITSSHPEGKISSDQKVVRRSQKKSVSTLATTRINPENVADLFAHEYAPGKYGAKGLTYVSQEFAHNTVFWQTGEGSVGREVHHRDVLAAMLRAEAEELSEHAEINLAVAENFAIRATRPGPPHSREINLGFVDGLTHLAEQMDETAARLRAQAELLSDVRNQSSFPADRMPTTQGFQLTAVKSRGGGWKIVRLDVDSSVTAAQISAGTEIDGAALGAFIANVHASIDPALRGYRTVNLSRPSELKIVGKLELPPDLRAARPK